MSKTRTCVYCQHPGNPGNPQSMKPSFYHEGRFMCANRDQCLNRLDRLETALNVIKERRKEQ